MWQEELNTLENKVSIYENEIQKEIGKREYIRQEIKDISNKEEGLLEKISLYESVNILFQKTSEFARVQAKNHIQDLTTKCLQYVFEKDFEFIIEFVERRNNVEADFYVSSYFDGVPIKTRPELSHGGGLVDVLSLALRFAFLEQQSPRIDGPLFLDEPGKHVSNDYIFNLGEFIKQSGDMFGRQIIMVTHNPHLSQICDKAFYVKIRDGKSIVTENEIF
ncbi:MAG: ATPase [Tissierellia bacterium]|nr:ATPase [Tissierellia bacterium]